MAGFEIDAYNYYNLSATATVSGGAAYVTAKLVVSVEGDSEVTKPTEDEVAEGLRDWFTTEYPGFQTVTLKRVDPVETTL
jgi:hypothetical protein